MRSKAILGVGVVILLILGVFFWSRPASAIGTLDIYDGSARIVRGSDEITAAVGDEVRVGDVIRAPAGSRIGIVLADGSVLRLEGGSEIVITELTVQNGVLKSGRIDLSEGNVWSDINSPYPVDYVVETPTVVATVRGTSFNVFNGDEVDGAYVSGGTVNVALKNDSDCDVDLEAGEAVTVKDDETTCPFESEDVPDDRKGDWIRFNEEKDRDASSASSSETSKETSSAKSAGKSSQAASKEEQRSSAAKSETTQASSKEEETPVDDTTVVKLTLSAPKGQIDLSELLQLTVKGATAAGNLSDETKSVQWEVHRFTIGTVDGLGQFHPAEVGKALIYALKGDLKSNGINVTVTDASGQQGGGGTTGGTQDPAAPTVTGVRVSCEKTTVPGTSGPPQTFAECMATISYSDNTTKTMSDGPVWSVSGSAKGTITQKGYYQAGSPQGQDTVTATFEGQAGSTTISVP